MGTCEKNLEKKQLLGKIQNPSKKQKKTKQTVKRNNTKPKARTNTKPLAKKTEPQAKKKTQSPAQKNTGKKSQNS